MVGVVSTVFGQSGSVDTHEQPSIEPSVSQLAVGGVLSGPPLSVSEGTFPIYNNTNPQCPDNQFYQPSQPVVALLQGQGAQTREGAPPLSQPTVFLQDSGMTDGGLVTNLQFRYATGQPGPLPPIRIMLSAHTQTEIPNVNGLPILQTQLNGLVGDSNPGDGLPEECEVILDLQTGMLQSVNLISGELFLATAPGVHPIWLERGSIGFSLETPLGLDFGPMIADGAPGNADFIRVLDQFARIHLPDTRFNYGGPACDLPLPQPFAGMNLLLTGPQPSPNLILFEDFDGAVPPTVQPLGSATLTTTPNGNLVVSNIGSSGKDGVSIVLDPPVKGPLCNMWRGIVLPPTIVDETDFVQFTLVAEADDGKGKTIEEDDLTVNLTEKDCRIKVLVTDKNGVRRLYRIKDRKLADVKSFWVDKVGDIRQVEIRFCDGTYWTSPDIDPPPGPTSFIRLNTNFPTIEFDAVGVEDQHRERPDRPVTLLTVPSLVQPVGLDGQDLDLQILVGASVGETEGVIDIRDLVPDSVWFGVPDHLGRIITSTPLINPSSTFTLDGEVWFFDWFNAPTPLSGLNFLYGLGVGIDGEVVQWGSLPIQNPDPVLYMAELGPQVGVNPVDIVLEVSPATPLPRIADGLDTVQLLISVNPPPDPSEQVVVRVTAGLDEDEPIIAESTGPGAYFAEYSATISGVFNVSAEVPGRTGFGFTEVEFQPLTPSQMDIHAFNNYQFPDGFTPIVVNVSTKDDNFNVVHPDFLKYDIDAPIPFSSQINSCGELELNFVETVPSIHSITVTELSSGMAGTVDIQFPVVGVRNAVDNPLIAPEEFEPTEYVVPLELYVHDGWNFGQVTVEFGAQMLTGAEIIGVVDTDPLDRFEISDVQIGRSGKPCDPTQFIQITFDATEPGGGDIASADLMVVVPADAGGGPSEPVTDVITVTSVVSDAVHPIYGESVVPVIPEVTWTWWLECVSKTWYIGEIIYVRGRAGAGKTLVTQAQICAMHNQINETLEQANIYFNKKYCDVVMDEASLGGAICGKGAGVMQDVMDYAEDAIDSCGIPIGPKSIKFAHLQNMKDLKGTTRPTGIGGNNASVSKAYRGSRTPAHEICHNLGLPHVHTAGNLMKPTDSTNPPQTGTDLTDDQITTVQGSDFVNARVLSWYYMFPCPYTPLEIVVETPTGDSDGDGDVDLVDFALFQLAFTGSAFVGPLPPTSVVFDFDCDGDVDLVNFAAFQLAFTGSS